MANKHTKRCSTLSAVKGMQIKATVCHLYNNPLEYNILKRILSMLARCKTVGENAKWSNHVAK